MRKKKIAERNVKLLRRSHYIALPMSWVMKCLKTNKKGEAIQDIAIFADPDKPGELTIRPVKR